MTLDPTLLSIMRKVMPSIIAHDICGVQPMTGPTGAIFSMKVQYAPENKTPHVMTNIEDYLDNFPSSCGDWGF